MRKNSSYKLYKRKTKEGGIVYYFDIPDSISGRGRIRESCFTDIEEEAHAIAFKKVTELKNENIYGKKPRINFLKAHADYWIEHAQFLKSNVSVAAYCKTLLVYFGGSTSFDKIDNAAVRAYIAWRRVQVGKITKRPITNATINRELATLRKMHSIATKDWKVEVGVIDFDRLMLPERDKHITFLTEEQIYKVIDASKGYFKNLIKFTFLTGVRRSDATHFHVSQIDLARDMITFRVKSRLPEGKIVELPMYDELREFILTLKPAKSGYMFTRNGKPVVCPSKALVAACKQAGVTLPKGQKMHVIRHSTATFLLNRGVPAHKVQEILGHACITTTKRYAHVLDKDKRDALDDAFKGFSTQIGHTK